MFDAIGTHQRSPHAPHHWFVDNENYLVTASTLHKQRIIDTPEKLSYVQDTFFSTADQWGWEIHAWAFLSNHYHVVMKAPGDATTLTKLIKAHHSKTAIWLNEVDRTQGREVWYLYRDTCLTYQKSYLARLHYVHANPQRHRVVSDAADYPWCSMNWFRSNAPEVFRKTVLGFKIDKVNVWDDFD